MLSTIILKIRSFLTRNFLIMLGMSSVAFIFEACYGMPKQDLLYLVFKGKIVSSDSLKPVKNIQVVLTELDNNNAQISSVTDTGGNYSIYATYVNTAAYKLTANDIDGSVNGSFYSKDSTVNVNSSDIKNNIKITNLRLIRK